MKAIKEEEALGQAVLDLVAASPLNEDLRMTVLLNAVCSVLVGIECLDCRRKACDAVRGWWPSAIANVMKAPSGDHDHHLHSVH
jgi:hypothetical protein